jgi:chromatin segregation and condensation protein Rec8/ScpA/Scc1 (kleisin family)
VEKDILKFLSKKGTAKITFSKFLESVDELKISQQYIVTCFSALLELVKYQQILLYQPNVDDDLLFCINTKKDDMQDSLMKS